MEDYDETLHERALERELSALRSLFEYHPDGIVTLKGDGRIARVNVALEGMTGFYGEQIVGKDWTELIAPECRGEASDVLSEALRGEAVERESLLLDRLGNRLDVALKLVPLRADDAVRGAYAIFRDVSAQKSAERAIEEQGERLRRLYTVAAQPGGTYKEKIDATLALGVELFGYDGAFVTQLGDGGERVRNVASAVDPPPVQVGDASVGDGKWSALVSVALEVAGNAYGSLAFVGRAPRHAVPAARDRDVMQLIGLFIAALIERETQNERIEALAFTDAVTGLPNRVLFDMRLNHTIATARRYDRGFAVMYLDFDHFKRINDAYGHPVGDRVLEALGRRLGAQLRESDTLARLGGDEFAILQPIVDGPSDAADLARKLHTAMQTPLLIDGVDHPAHISIGIALFPGDGDTAEGLIAAADRALYDAKHQGRNRWCFADESGARRDLRKRKLLDQAEG